MAALPAHCFRCGFDFEVSGLVGGDVNELALHNVRVPCPRCDGQADMLDGTYRLQGDLVTILSMPNWSADRLRRLRSAVRTVERASGPAEVESVVAEIARADPAAASLLRRVLASKELGNAAAALSALAAVVAILITLLTLGANLNERDVARIVDQKLQERREAPTGPPSPTPGPPAAASSAPPAAPTLPA